MQRFVSLVKHCDYDNVAGGLLFLHGQESEAERVADADRVNERDIGERVL